jgi:hypothetical protein
LGKKRIHQKLVTTLGDDASEVSQIKIWLQKFRNGDLSFNDVPRAGRPPLTLGPQPKRSLEKYPFSSAQLIKQYFFTTDPAMKDILQGELEMQKSLRRWVPRVDASTAMLRIRQESKANQFEGIATGGESWS